MARRSIRVAEGRFDGISPVMGCSRVARGRSRARVGGARARAGGSRAPKAGRKFGPWSGHAVAAAMLTLSLLAGCAETGIERSTAEGVDPEDRTAGPVGFDLLRAIVPDTLPGLSRREVSNVDGGVAGVDARSVAVEYGTGEGDESVRLVVTDLGPLRGDQGAGSGWAPLAIDSETETGYERTTRLEGHPAFERYGIVDGERRGEVSVVVGRRFVVEARGSQVGMEVLRDVVRASNLARLRAIAEAMDAEAKAAQPREEQRLTDG